MSEAATVERQVNPVAIVRNQLDNMSDQFKSALPAHIPVERFARVLMTAIQNNPELMDVERRSLWNAAMKAAQDGLLPDGREGAIVVFKDKNRGKIAQWMPMIGGLRKKVRNSGEIATWDVYVVHENDEFEYELGDTPFIRHRPTLEEPGKVIAAYSVAVLKSGEKTREVMSVAAIEKVRAVSLAKDSPYGPWNKWYDEMCRKTVARRHSKVLPMSTDLDDLLRRDEDLYDMKGARQEAQADRPKSLSGKLDTLARLPEPAKPDAVDPETGEVREEKPADPADEPPTKPGGAPADQPATEAPSPTEQPTDAILAAQERGREDCRKGVRRLAPTALGKEEREAWLAAYDDEKAALSEAAE